MPTEEIQVAPPKQSLMQITDSILEIFGLMESAPVEDRPSIEAELQRIISIDLASKTDGIVWAISRCDLDNIWLESLIDEVCKRIEANEERKRRIRAMVLAEMQKLGASLIKGALHSISLRPGSESLNITNDLLLPEKYKDTQVVKVIDKARIKRDLKLGIAVPGAELVRGEEGITVR